MKKLIQQGAEAKIYLVENSKNKIVLKSRTKKSYRHPVLDEKIRKSRTKKEAKILSKALEAKINVPKVLNIDYKARPKNKFNLEIEFIQGERLSETLNNKPEKEQFQTMQKIGEQVAKLHKKDIIHADLTTSNIILKSNKIFIIDFGLGFISKKIEDKAVDLHLIKQALEAKHFQNHTKLFNHFLKTYKTQNKESEKILNQLKKVETRGRYKY